MLQPEIPLDCIIILLSEGACYAFCHGVVKIGDRLPPVHLVLVGLDRDTGQRRIAGDGSGLPDISVSRGEPVLEQFDQVDLAAGFRQHVKIFVVDVNIPMDVRRCDILGQDIVVHKIVGTFGTIFQHGSHGGIRINIRVFPFDVRVCGTGERQFSVNIHQICFRLTDLSVFCTVQDIRFRSLGETIFNQLFLHQILDLLHIRRLSVRNRIHHRIHQFFKLIRSNRLHSRCFIGLPYGIPDLLNIKRHRRPVPLPDQFRAHNHASSHPHSSMIVPHLPVPYLRAQNSLFSPAVLSDYSAYGP